MTKINDGSDDIYLRSNVMVAYSIITQKRIKDIDSIKRQIINNTSETMLPEMRSTLRKFMNAFYY